MHIIDHRTFLSYLTSIAIYAMDKDRSEAQVHLTITDIKNISPAVFRKVYQGHFTKPMVETLYQTIFGLLEVFSGMEKLPPIPIDNQMELALNDRGQIEVTLIVPLREITSTYKAFPQFAVQLFVREEGAETDIDSGHYRLEWAAFKPLRKLHRYETAYNTEIRQTFERLRIPLHVLLWRFTRFVLNNEDVKIELTSNINRREYHLKGIRDASHVHHMDVVIER